MALRGKGYSEFLPVYSPDNVKPSNRPRPQVPLFPGYVFCRFEFDNRLPILKTPGVLQVIGAGKLPVPIDENEIDALRSVIRSGLPRLPYPFLTVGDKVVVSEGPLKGLAGIMLRERRQERLIISITLLKRSVAVEIDRACVVPVGA